jgi:chaperonin cofactor prefoldin
MEQTNNELLQGLLYRKEVAELHIEVLEQGIKTYTDFIDWVDKQENFFEFNQCLAFEYKAKAQELSVQHKNTIASYNECAQRIKNIMEKDPTITDIVFQDLKSRAEKMAENEIYGSVGDIPANVEQPKIIDEIKEYISLKEAAIAELEESESAVSSVLAFEYKRHIMTLQKRLNERLKYYNEVFLPIYEKDMKECRRYLDKYMERAKVFADSKIDIHLGVMLTEYKKHKHEKENLWLFYTVLRDRVDKCIEHLKTQKDIPSQFRNYLMPVRK